MDRLSSSQTEVVKKRSFDRFSLLLIWENIIMLKISTFTLMDLGQKPSVLKTIAAFVEKFKGVGREIQ